MSTYFNLKMAYHMGYEDALAKHKPEPSKASVLGRGTCNVEGSIDYGEFGCWQYDLSCGCRIIWPDNEPPMFCPECGRMVVE